jgi:hypothetical protein
MRDLARYSLEHAITRSSSEGHAGGRVMTTRSSTTPRHAQPPSAAAPKTPAQPKDRRKAGAKQEPEPPVRTAKQDKERSDWEGMTPKPEQGSDDVAAPGQVPETQH